MATYFEEIIKSSEANCQIFDITEDIEEIIEKSKIKNGIVTVFAIGSTAGVTTLEYEPGLIKDLPKLMEKLIPTYQNYGHNETWGDGNGHSHLRSALIKTSLTIPLVNSEMTLGTWQQIVFIDFDNKHRTRRIAIQIMGEN
ncbi:MAG: secondary thiamine-phosphate synthase enzyme YjbQ [Ignavibacteriae bacterium]|nr:secondary thiamine-phosphate synthase enzyme YjbQ [Ignavibacteriota bacterium]